MKIGDTYSLSFRISVSEDGVDITSTIDFSQWSFSCQYKDQDDNLIYTVSNPAITDGVIDCSLPSDVTAGLVAGVTYKVDIRTRDEDGVVRSSATRDVVFEEAVSETP